MLIQIYLLFSEKARDIVNFSNKRTTVLIDELLAFTKSHLTAQQQRERSADIVRLIFYMCRKILLFYQDLSLELAYLLFSIPNYSYTNLRISLYICWHIFYGLRMFYSQISVYSYTFFSNSFYSIIKKWAKFCNACFHRSCWLLNIYTKFSWYLYLYKAKPDNMNN